MLATVGDLPLGQHAQEGVSNDRAGHGHGPLPRRVNGYLHPLPDSPIAEHGVHQETGLIGGRRTPVGHAGDQYGDLPAVELGEGLLKRVGSGGFIQVAG